MTDSIYNNAGMPSEQGAAPEIPEDLREWYWAINSDNPAICWRYETAISNEKAKAFIERIAALTLERDTLKAERSETEMEKLNRWQAESLKAFRDKFGAHSNLEALDAIDALKAERDAFLRALALIDEDAAVIHRVPSKVLAARASAPPAHPINDDEQRRKDAGWNDRPKARCICGEMIAWYSGEYLHVAGRSKSCADGRLASPAHFLVGMPPAGPEWKKEA